MEITALIRDISVPLVPLLPYLLRAGDSAAVEAGKKLAGEAWDGLNKLWSMLQPKINASPGTLNAAQEVALAPGDPDAQGALRFQLRKLLSEDPKLAAEINECWEQIRRSGVHLMVSGDRNVVSSENIDRSTIVTGDHNLIDR